MKYLIRPSDLTPYSPANHTGTRNFRLIEGRNVEVILGEVERGKGALPHAHPGIEQVCYLLEAARTSRWPARSSRCAGRSVLLSGGCAASLPGHLRQSARARHLLAALS